METTASTRLSPNLTGTPETLLGILYARAVDARAPSPILADRHAARLVDQLDYDWARLRPTRARCAVFALRARFLDRWAGEFLREARGRGERAVTVLHLAAGLDTRALRVLEGCGYGDGGQGQGQGREENHDDDDDDDDDEEEEEEEEGGGPLVHWVDSDLPEVVGLREKLGVPRPRASWARVRYECKAVDVTEANWLARLGLPRGAPTMIVFEGLSMYLQPAQGRALLDQLTAYFVPGEGDAAAAVGPNRRNQVCFDCLSWLPVALQRLEPIVARTGARFCWAVDEPRALEGGPGGLRLRDEVFPLAAAAENAVLPFLVRWAFWLGSWVPVVRRMGRYVRFEW